VLKLIDVAEADEPHLPMNVPKEDSNRHAYQPEPEDED
jgi:hypothetical protein